MPRLALQIRAQFENVTNLRPSSDDYVLMVKTKCNSCQEEHPKLVGIQPGSEVEISGGRGVADLVMKCQFCKRESSAKFEEPTSKAPLWRPYTVSEDGGAEWQTLCILDARGLDLIGWDPEGTWSCSSTESKTKFEEVEFDSNEWTDYDENGNVPVSIMELEGRWVKA
ncbi:unnamed protein product [Sympodiomycopsis kandeliae]